MEGGQGKCSFRYYQYCYANSFVDPDYPTYTIWNTREILYCSPDGSQFDGGNTHLWLQLEHNYTQDGQGNRVDSETICQHNYYIEGFYYYLCGPDDIKNGHDFNGERDDDVHGNGSTGKRREKTDGTGALTAGLYSMGNKFNDMEACKELRPGHVNPPDFKSVTPVIDRGIAPNWEPGVNSCLGMSCDFTLRSVRGLGNTKWIVATNGDGDLVYEPTDDPFCIYGFVEYNYGMSDDEHLECTVSPGAYPVCQGDEVFVRIDLNTDARGIPRLFDYPSNLRNPPDWRGPCLTHAHPTTCDAVGAIPSIPEIP